MSNETKIIDFIFLQHGFSVATVNVKEHWGAFGTSLKKELGENCIIKCCNANSVKGKTFDGFYAGALRLANEICEELKEAKKQRGEEKYRLHFIGHSMGGIYFRIAIYILNRRKLFDDPNYIPFSYVSLEAPHLGVKKPAGNGIFDTLYSGITQTFWNGQSVNDLALNDRPYPPYDEKCVDELPILMRICEDDYLDVLRKFKHLTLVQNIRFSYQCPYVSAAIDRALPYTRDHMKDLYLVEAFDFDEKYSDILSGCTNHYELQPEKGEVFEERVDGCVIYERIVSKLNTLPWRRMNVHFRTKSADAHLFIMGDMYRNKMFKNWRNDDTDVYLKQISQIFKRDIELDDKSMEESKEEVKEVQQEQVEQPTETPQTNEPQGDLQ